MNVINEKINQLKKENKLGLMTHTVLGYPTIEKNLEIIRTLISAGSDFLELQIPFSDPVADGKTIMKACETSLKNGMNTDRAFEIIEKSESEIPVLFMAYYNTVFRYGIEKFCKKASKLKISGLIVPDIPPEEEKSEKFIKTCLKFGLSPIRVVSPSSSIERLKINARFASGFVYCVSHFGVTGSQIRVDKVLFDYLKLVKQVTKLPVAVGFGIEKAYQIRKLRNIADMAIAGSAIIKKYDRGGIKQVSRFIKSFKAGTIM